MIQKIVRKTLWGLFFAFFEKFVAPILTSGGHPALSTAYMNDCEPLLCFAQQVNGYGKAGDVFLGISTSGNSRESHKFEELLTYIDGMIRYKLLLYEDIPAEEIDDCGNIVGWDTFRRYDIDR